MYKLHLNEGMFAENYISQALKNNGKKLFVPKRIKLFKFWEYGFYYGWLWLKKIINRQDYIQKTW